MKIKAAIFAAFVLFAVAAVNAVLVSPQGTVLKHITTLRGDNELPHFSWILEHPERMQEQSAYEITLRSSNGQVFWSSGKVKSAQTHMIPYSGPTLPPSSRFSWTVDSWDRDGRKCLPSSAAGTFETGLEDWESSQFITSGLGEGLIRKEFVLDQDVTQATLYVTGMGFVDIWVNGELVTDFFGNGWTTFRKRLLYTMYDCTKLVRGAAGNAIGAMLTKGWADWDSFPSRSGGDVFGPPSFRALLRLTLANGTTISVGTDATWSFDRAPVTYASIYNGESYDARLEQNGWNLPNFVAPWYGFWQPAHVIDSPTAAVTRLMHPPMKILEVYSPLSISEPKNGTYVVKFPHNISGMCRLRVKGKRGTQVTLRHAEILNHPPLAPVADGMIYTDNLRSAKATDTYILRGTHHQEQEEYETFTPRNTYHGFQFVEVTGYPGILTVDDIQALFVASAIESRSELKFSVPVLNNLQERAVRGQRANLMSVPTDCPQRDERLGWMGDANLSAESFMLNFDIASFLANYLRLIADEQSDDGAVPDVVPCARYASRQGEPAWAGAFPTLAYGIYRYFGDLSPVKEQIDNLARYVEFLNEQEKETGLLNFYASYGDWCPPPPAPRASIHLTAAYSYLKSVGQVAELEAALGNSPAAKTFAAELPGLVAEFERAYWNKTDKRMDIGVQTDNAIGLDLNLPTAEVRSQLANELIDDIVVTNNLHMTTGIIGAKVLLPVLAKMGREDVAFEIASQITYPSWGYMQYNGVEEASTIWELLDAPVEGPGMNSRNHHMFSSISAYLYSIAGLKIADGPAGAGFKNFKFAPKPLNGLSSAALTIQTPMGKASLEWEMKGGVQCFRAAENTDLTLDCGAGGTIESVSASFGLPIGGCAVGFSPSSTCHHNSSSEIVAQNCVGKQSCTVPANINTFGSDPCPAELKVLIATAKCSNLGQLNISAVIPMGSVAQVVLPDLGHGLEDLSIVEGEDVWFREGRMVAASLFAGTAKKEWGVMGGRVDKEKREVEFTVGSGTYHFVASSRFDNV